MKTNLKLLLATCVLALITACGNNASTGASANSGAAMALTGSPLGYAPTAVAQSVDAYRPPDKVTSQDSPMKPRDLNAAPVATSIPLGAPLVNQAAQARKSNGAVAESHMGKPLQIGFDREVAQTSTVTGTMQVLKWQATAAGGQVAALNFRSTGAKGMRVGLLVTELPASATLRFYAKGAANAYEVKGSEVLAVLAKNLAAGDKSDAGRTYWAPAVDSADATVEIEIPAGVETSSVAVSVPKVSHIFMSNKEISAVESQINYAGDANAGLSCQVDVKCSSPMPAATDAVVHLIFKEIDGDYICSGTMLNDATNSGKPFLLTANHCISNQTVASTLTTWFKYRSTTCNDGTTGERYPTYGGADLKYTAYNTDSTLLQLRASPNVSGVLYAGWDATTPPANATTVHTVHHPQGDQQRLSRGSITGYSVRNATDPNYFLASTLADGTILDVRLTTGLTEGGSSGSGLFKGADSNPQLIGQLFGGTNPSCTVPGGSVATPANNVYGRFDVAFKAGMNAWLSPASVAASLIRQPVYRFYNTQTNVYFYTIYTAERDTILSTLADVLTYEGIAFYASPIATAGYSTIYRFRNTVNGSYLYTISEVEKTSILQNYPQYVLEGTAWYAEPSAAGGGSPLYRFRTNNNSHIYTAYESEKASILTNYPSFVYEGPAYYVKLTP